MTVSSPDDASEIEAAQVADSVSASTETAPVSRAAVEEEEPLQGSFIDRAEPEEEEPLVQGSFIDRATPEDEELMQGSFIDREAEDAPRMV
jgi:hypothetical protein